MRKRVVMSLLMVVIWTATFTMLFMSAYRCGYKKAKTEQPPPPRANIIIYGQYEQMVSLRP